MLRLQSRYSLTDSSTIMNKNYRECYRKSNTKQRRILWTRVRVFHPDFKNDTRVICNLDIEMHLDFGIVLISTRLWTRASFHQCMVLWFYSFIHVFFSQVAELLGPGHVITTCLCDTGQVGCTEMISRVIFWSHHLLAVLTIPIWFLAEIFPPSLQ